MTLKSLQYLVENKYFEPGTYRNIDYRSLPPSWNTFDLGRFSSGITLWDYQQTALRLAVLALSKYYAGFSVGEDAGEDQARRQRLADWYKDAMSLTEGQRRTLNLSLGRAKRPLRQLLAPYYGGNEDASAVDFSSICNRMGFWMATGSGKTVVLVKLLEVLHSLMQRREIPCCEVLYLTPREDLIEQFRQVVREFNLAADAPIRIELRELRKFPETMRQSPAGSFNDGGTLRIFYYRSDNLSDVQKDRIVDFRNYDNNGRWYVLLDEAHKGDSEDSKRKHIYSLMARSGFLFNFSATFTDPLDLATTVHNFNLSEFITAGYGKHIAVLQQELTAFRNRPENADYTDEEKRKVVAKSMLLLAYTTRQIREIRAQSGQPDLYHQPMLMALVNSINTEDADLKIYFEQILAIGRGEVRAAVWRAAADELWEELREEPAFVFESDNILKIAEGAIRSLGMKDVLQEVYNLDNARGGEVEVLVRPGNKKELAFKMKASSRPFALIKIGDITPWLQNNLPGFEFSETLDTESFFTTLNDPDSSINILMGSRSFYEGWDSNRPNVINFVNIGVGEDARKFILQSVGRGVRVQSWNGKRRRLAELWSEFDDRDLFRKLKKASTAPETLYVLGTNREALRVVLEELKKERTQGRKPLRLELNRETQDHLLLVPQYNDKGRLLVDERTPAKFPISASDFDLLQQYSSSIADDRVLVARHGVHPRNVRHFRGSIKKPDTYYSREGSRSFRNLDVMVGRVFEYFGLTLREVEGLRELVEDDIVHFKHMEVDEERAQELQKLVDQALRPHTPEGKAEIQDIQTRSLQGEFDLMQAVQEVADRGLTGKTAYKGEITVDTTKAVAKHYYLPMVLSDAGRHLEYARHIIDVDSEVRFLKELSGYVAKQNECALNDLDWWLFSKLDQYLDSPFIPYYDPKSNADARFRPDFIFWGQKGDRYRIMFVDPKGIEHIDWQRKVDGYIRHFEQDGQPLVFDIDGLKVDVVLRLWTKDINKLPESPYSRHWVDSISTLCESLIAD